MSNMLRNAEIYGVKQKKRLAPFRGDRVDKRLYGLSIALILLSLPLRQPLLLVSGLILLLSLALIDIWSLYSLRHIRYQRQLSEQKALFGEEITLSIRLENAKLLPLPFLEVEENIANALPLQGHTLRKTMQSNFAQLEALFSLRWYERVTRQYTLRCMSRGVHAIGPTTLRSSDAFGFLSQELTVSDKEYIMVYPLVVPLTSFHLPARRPFGDQRLKRRLLEDPMRVLGVRDYVYGDNLRRIDWKATAREQQLQSKIYESTTTYNLTIFLNASMQIDRHYGIHPEIQELSICAAASVADWGIANGYAVGLYANTSLYIPDEKMQDGSVEEQENRRRIRLPANSSAEQRVRIMESLARINSYFKTTLEEVIYAERTRLATGATIVVITSVLSERLTELLIGMRRAGHDVTILFVSDTTAPSRIGGIPLHHIGGTETWEKLQQNYTQIDGQAKNLGLSI